MNDRVRVIADVLARRHGGNWERLEDVRPPELMLMIVEDAEAIDAVLGAADLDG